MRRRRRKRRRRRRGGGIRACMDGKEGRKVS
jgi:hypothetical protein